MDELDLDMSQTLITFDLGRFKQNWIILTKCLPDKELLFISKGLENQHVAMHL